MIGGKNRLSHDALVSFLMNAFCVVALYAADLLGARVLDLNGFGIYSIVVSWVYIFGLLATFGLNQLILRHLPVYLANNDLRLAKGLLRQCNRWVFLASSGLVTLFNIGIFLLPIQGALYWSLVVGSLAVPCAALSNLRQATLRSVSKVWQALIGLCAIRPIVLSAGLLVIFLSRAPVPVEAVVSVFLASYLVAYLISNSFVKKTVEIRISDREVVSFPETKAWQATAVGLFLATNLGVIITRIDVVMLGMFGQIEAVGKYAVAYRISETLIFGLATINIVAAPNFSLMYSKGDLYGLEKLIRRIAKWSLLGALPLVILMLAFGERALMFFGEGYADAYYPLLILMAGQLTSVLAGPIGQVFLMAGFHKNLVKFIFSSAVLNIVGDIVLIPHFGMIGAAISTAVSFAALNLLMYGFSRSVLRP